MIYNTFAECSPKSESPDMEPARAGPFGGRNALAKATLDVGWARAPPPLRLAPLCPTLYRESLRCVWRQPNLVLGA